MRTKRNAKGKLASGCFLLRKFLHHDSASLRKSKFVFWSPYIFFVLSETRNDFRSGESFQAEIEPAATSLTGQLLRPVAEKNETLNFSQSYVQHRSGRTQISNGFSAKLDKS